MKIKIAICLCLLLASFFIPAAAGDGVVYRSSLEKWDRVQQRKQFAVIDHHDGRERLTLAIDLEGVGPYKKMVWLFPIPAQPQNTEVAITENVPNIEGENINGVPAKIALGSFLWSLGPLTLVVAPAMMGGVEPDSGVTVFEHIEKHGLTTELIDANDSQALYTYLSEKDLDLPDKTVSLLEEYTGQGYCFVASWASGQSYELPPQEVVGVEVTFPAEEIYYPLHLTSAYGDMPVPITVQVRDAVSLADKMSSNLTEHVSIEYKTGYTELTIETSADNLVGDMWLKQDVPFSVAFPFFLGQHLFAVGVAVMALSSCTASLCSGLLVYRRYNPDAKKFCLFGLAHLTSILGMAALAKVLKIDKRFVDVPAGKERVYNKAWYLATFFFIFLVIVAGISYLLSLP